MKSKLTAFCVPLLLVIPWTLTAAPNSNHPMTGVWFTDDAAIADIWLAFASNGMAFASTNSNGGCNEGVGGFVAGFVGKYEINNNTFENQSVSFFCQGSGDSSFMPTLTYDPGTDTLTGGRFGFTYRRVANIDSIEFVNGVVEFKTVNVDGHMVVNKLLQGRDALQPFMEPTSLSKGESFKLTDPQGRMEPGDEVRLVTAGGTFSEGLVPVNLVISPDGTMATGLVPAFATSGPHTIEVREPNAAAPLFTAVPLNIT